MICKQSSLWVQGISINSVWNAGRQKQCRDYYGQTQASLSSVDLSHNSLKGYSDPSIHSESGHQPSTPSLCSPRLAMWRDCGQVGEQVCSLIQNDKSPPHEPVAWRQWLARLDRGGPAISQTWCPGAVTEARSVLAMYHEIICLLEKVVHIYQVCLYLSISGRQKERHRNIQKTVQKPLNLSRCTQHLKYWFYCHSHRGKGVLYCRGGRDVSAMTEAQMNYIANTACLIGGYHNMLIQISFFF